MPVPDFSPSNSALRRNSGHSDSIVRWNTTREGSLEDDKKANTGEMTEMGGTDLHERENWPLGPSLETQENGENEDLAHTMKSLQGARSPGPIEEVAVIESASLRRSQNIGEELDTAYVRHRGHNADWKQNEVIQEAPTDSRLSSLDERSRDDKRETMLNVQRQNVSSELLPSVLGSDLQGESVESSMHSGSRRSLRTPGREDSSSVSPVRAEDAQQPENRTDRSCDEPRGSSERSVSPEPEPDIRQSLNNSYPIRESDFEQDEVRDTSTPIRFSTDNRSATPSTPLFNRTTAPLYNGHNDRQNSIANTTPPTRNTSKRSISSPYYQMAQMAHNRATVRYSWQSIQDAEPNRPRIHIIKLVSNAATASAGFPQGEAFGFSISPGGRRIAAYNSTRLYILQTAALPVGISQDYALKRRPLAVEIVDDGNMLAILADEHTVNIYDLDGQKMQRIRTIKLDFPTHCIALAPPGGLLAAAYEGGVEIFSLDPTALPTDRRAVRSHRVDRLTFSEDGSTLLGTTTRINVSSTVVVSVPVFPASPSNIPTSEELKEAWCSDLLHPENIRNSSHATFMRENRTTCNERLFAWNGLADTFGILNISDMEYGNLDFPVVINPPLSTCGGLGAAIHSCPAIDEHGDTVAMIVNDRTIRLYIVPHKVHDDETTVEAHSIDHELDEGYGCPFSDLRWVYSSSSLPAPLNNQTQVQGRLIVSSPGGVLDASTSEEMVDDIEGGRIVIFDFDPQFTGQPGQTFSLTLGKSVPQLLEEPELDVGEEVALVRRRTVHQSKSLGLSQRPVTLGRAATTFGRTRVQGGASRPRLSINSLFSEATRSLPDLVEGNEVLGTFEEPYAQNAPRSQLSLMRAASNAQRHRFQTLEERHQENVSVDSTGNFLALPEYTEEPNAPLPRRFRALAGLDVPAAPPSNAKTIKNANGDRDSPVSWGPMTAPATVGETFSAEHAFASASMADTTAMATTSSVNATSAPQQGPSKQQTQHSLPLLSRDAVKPQSSTDSSLDTPQQSETFDSITSVPRSLQRAYESRSTSALSSRAPSSPTGDWENASPVIGTNVTRQFPISPSSGTAVNSTLMSSRDTVPEDEPWDTISPVRSPWRTSPFGHTSEVGNPFRHSTSLLNPPGHATPIHTPSRGSPVLSSAPSSSDGRRVPPHIQAFRNAAAAASVAQPSASLFPPNPSSDYVPHRQMPAKIGDVGHPIMAWHPPAPSNLSTPPPGNMRTHSKKSSLSNKGAFASTDKARRLGFFKRKKQPFAPDFEHQRRGRGTGIGRGDESMMETRSMFTTLTRSDGKCVVM